MANELPRLDAEILLTQIAVDEITIGSGSHESSTESAVVESTQVEMKQEQLELGPDNHSQWENHKNSDNNNKHLDSIHMQQQRLSKATFSTIVSTESTQRAYEEQMLETPTPATFSNDTIPKSDTLVIMLTNEKPEHDALPEEEALEQLSVDEVNTIGIVNTIDEITTQSSVSAQSSTHKTSTKDIRLGMYSTEPSAINKNGQAPLENSVAANNTSPKIDCIVGEIDQTTLQARTADGKYNQQSPKEIKDPSKVCIDNSDVASRAAMALAAVAAAATANNTSPSAAAEAARALAPGLVPESATSTLPMKREHQGKRNVQFVNLLAVKECLRVRLEQTRTTNQDQVGKSGDLPLTREYHTSYVTVNKRLAFGENDAFLRHLLMLEYYITDENLNTDIPKSPLKLKQESDAKELEVRTSARQNKDIPFDPDETIEHDTALAASEKVRSMLFMAEDAYDAMEALLPRVPRRVRLDTEGSDPIFGIDTHHVVPDLLPPCTSANGDATSQFFRACIGDKLTFGPIIATETTMVYTATEVLHFDEEPPPPPPKNSTFVFKNMFSGMARSKGSPARKSALVGVFSSKKGEPEKNDCIVEIIDSVDQTSDEYSVVIDCEMLGLTVENVLERTVVRTVLATGAAKRSGVMVGSLIVKVGNVDTSNLTHFETIDELRQSVRPLKLCLKPISHDELRSARDEMGRLIRGGGFGTSLPIDKDSNEVTKMEASPRTSPKVEAFSQVLHQRWTGDGSLKLRKKEQSLMQAGEKLVWILTLLIIGLEREASTAVSTSLDISVETTTKRHASHSAEDYADSAKSVAKVLFDFIKLSAQSTQEDERGNATASFFDDSYMNSSSIIRRKRNLPPPPPTGRVMKHGASGVKSSASEALLRIGDVLHRTRTFLADPLSPPASMLRGEVIAFLCDVLDIDSEMELSEEEAVLASSGGVAGGSMNDLGSAGSLLKLIVLNCSIMRSPECAALASTYSQEDTELAEEEKRRFGLSRQHPVFDVHRFHAGNRFLAIVHRLAASRSISAKVTACSLGPILWGHLDFPHQLQLRGVITRALHDVDVLVRKSTAAVLHEIAELVFDPRAVPWLVLMCERAMTDPEPQLRAAAMTLTWHLSEHLPNAFLGDASQGSRSVRRLPRRDDPTFAEVYLLQCKLLPVATRLAEDRSPAVRLAVAAQCDRLCSALGDHWYRIIIDVLLALLVDADERVRGEAILCVPRLTEVVLVSTSKNGAGNGGVLEALLPISLKLQKDASVDVRVALAMATGELLTLLVGLESLEEIPSPGLVDQCIVESGLNGYKKHVDETLIPILQNLLHDNVPEVTSAALRAVTNASRGNVREIRSHKKSTSTDDDNLSLSSFQSHASLEKKDPVFIPVLSETQVLRLLPTLADLAMSGQWRVRQGAVEIVPALLGCTHKLETRTEIAQLCFRLMSDRVDAVRRTAAECLCLGGGGRGGLGSHGDDCMGWMNAIVIPHVKFCHGSQNSKQRMLSLKMIEVIVMNGMCIGKYIAGEKSLQRELVELALSLACDKVANVRLNVGRVLCTLIAMLEEDEVTFSLETLQDQLKIELKKENGGDRDVIFFARRAIQNLEEVSLRDATLTCNTLDDSNR